MQVQKADDMQYGQSILSIVKLNVGGHYFTTSRQTLTRDPNSMLAAMFSGKFEMKPHEDGTFFIDRDGTHFRFILNYLRTGKLTSPEGEAALKELQEEAEFYQIEGLREIKGKSAEFNKRETECRRPPIHNKSSNTDQRSKLDAGRHVLREV